MESQLFGPGHTDGPDLSVRPQTKFVFNAFHILQQQVAEVQRLAQGTKPYLNVRPVTLLLRQLKNEFLTFRGVLAELTDNDYRETEGLDWTVIELAVESRCVSEYSRYFDSLSRILRQLEDITKLLGLAADLQLGAIEDIISNEERWAKLLHAIYTIDGSSGAALQVSLTRIKEANDNLVSIQRLSQKDPPANFFENLIDLRDHVRSAAEILGAENGFQCKASKPHQAYLRVRECLKPGESDQQDQHWDRACSLLFRNPSPRHGQWKQVDMRFKTRHVNRPTELRHPQKEVVIEVTGNATDGVEKRLTEMKKKQKLQKKQWKKIWPLSVFAVQPDDLVEEQAAAPSAPPTLPVLPQMTTDPSEGLCAFLNRQMGTETSLPTEMTVRRQDHKRELLLSLADMQAAKFDVGWSSPLPLQNRPTDTHRLDLSTEQKLQLAHKVAFSLFYLFSTPWITDSWTSKDVYITWQEDAVGIIYPVFSQNATAPGPTAPVSDAGELSQPKIAFTNRLGRFLVELWCGSPWAHLQKAFLAGDWPSGVVDPDTFIFAKLLNWVGDSNIADNDKPFHLEGSSYFMAVQKCFTCDFHFDPGDQASPLDNVNFSRWIYRHILRPLQYALEDFQANQNRVFGARFQLDHSITRPPSDQDRRRLRLFSNEELEGDCEKKKQTADDWFFQYGLVKELVRAVGRERPEKPTDRIRVAILDTGVDVTHDDLQRPWSDGQILFQNFVGTRSAIPQDDDGHGTHVTSILLQMAENVDIYVARVSPDGEHWNSSEVEQAIRWATNDKQVHIISISFGFPNADQSLEGIRRALLEAHAADVLIFAATGNEYQGKAIAFPACLDEVISVASTTGSHERSKFVPDLRVGKRLCAIGEAIEAAWIDKKGSNLSIHATTARKAGTSYATPVVAGVAAMTMDLIWSVKEENEYPCQVLRTNRGMLSVLEHMIWSNEEQKIQCLKPWIFFDAARWKFLEGKKSVAGMGRNILVPLIDALNNTYGNRPLKS